MRLRLQDAPAPFVQMGADNQPVRAVITAVKAVFFFDQQVRAPVQAAEHGEIPEGGGDLLVRAVFGKYPDGPRGIILYGLRHRQAEAGIAAPVAPGETAVDKHLRLLIGRFKRKEGFFPVRVPDDRLFIDRQALVGIVVAVPGVGKGDLLPAIFGQGVGETVQRPAGKLSEFPVRV